MKPYLIWMDPSSIDPGEDFTLTIDWSHFPEGTEAITLTIDFAEDGVQDLEVLVFAPVVGTTAETGLLTAPTNAVQMTVTESEGVSEPLEVTIGD